MPQRGSPGFPKAATKLDGSETALRRKMKGRKEGKGPRMEKKKKWRRKKPHAKTALARKAKPIVGKALIGPAGLCPILAVAMGQKMGRTSPKF